jgi:polar amino acid transport system substrate-binding protein
VNARWLVVSVAVVAVLALARPGVAQDKKDRGKKADEKKELRWGTDPTGGAPYVYKDDHGKYIGFEVDLAEYLAKELGRKSEMVTGDWDKLPELLGKPADDEDGIDIVLNGYEFREDLEKKYPSTVPYYVYKLGLVIHKDEADAIRSWSDLAREKATGAKRSVGVLGGSVAHEYMKDEFGDRIDLKINPDVATVIGLVEQKRLDATVQDTPAALYYVRNSKKLRLADEPRKPGFYVILTRQSDKELREQLNAAIKKAIKDGTLKKIYEKYGLWNEDQERLLYWTDQPWPPVAVTPEAEGETGGKKADWGRMLRELLQAAGMTVLLAVASFPLAMLIGLFVALGRVYGPWLVRFPLGLYVEFLRGTPLLLQLYFMFYLLPIMLSQFFGVSVALAPLAAGILGLAINYSAYEAENYRAGLLAVPRGQMEAALALGLHPLTALRVVIVPQAARIVIPPVTNDFIALFKDTSVCSVILITELTRKYNELYNFNREYIVQLAFITAGLYLIMSYPLAIAARVLEKRLGSTGGGHR